MNTYLVLSKDPNPQMAIAVQKAYPGAYFVWGESSCVVTTADTAKQISNKLGVRGEDHPLGLDHVGIFKLAPSYWGWTETDLWDFMAKSFSGSQ